MNMPLLVRSLAPRPSSTFASPFFGPNASQRAVGEVRTRRLLATPRAATQPRAMPSTQLSSRLAARLGQLPHDVLASLAARLCSDSPALEAAAEECMAAHTLLPHEMVEGVLLSPDLVPHILGPLEAEDGAAAAVCSQWLDGWKATNEAPWRRRLKQVPSTSQRRSMHGAICAV